MPNITDIKKRLLDVNDTEIDIPWNEGYLSALADHNIITEPEFDTLLNWIKTMED